jgi:hypothetical protein
VGRAGPGTAAKIHLPGHIATLAHRYLSVAALFDLADLGHHARHSNVDIDRSPSTSPPLTRAITDPTPHTRPPAGDRPDGR